MLICIVCVVVHNDISGKELRGQVGVGRVITSGSLDSLMVGELGLKWLRIVGLNPALGAIFTVGS